ncbi:unnamed protein product [Prunus brigantina]
MANRAARDASLHFTNRDYRICQGYDSDVYPAIRDPDSEDEESGSSGNEGVLNSSNKDHLANDHGNDEESDSSELHEGVEESDSSEDEVAPRNTIGDVPLEWYQDEKHIELTKEDIKSISRLLEGKAPHGDFDPYAPYVDWFKWDGSKHPLSNAPDPKRRFIPSKSESKLIKLAIHKGLIKPK